MSIQTQLENADTLAKGNPGNRFAQKSIVLIMTADTVSLEKFSTGGGYYLYIDGHFFCCIVNRKKLSHLFEILATKARML